jgi:hypothetical protein
MAKLSRKVQAFIVQALACYDKPQTVANAVFAQFQVKVTCDDVARYDPTRAAATQGGLAKEWNDLFHETRARFLKETQDIPIANPASRLRTLQRLAQRAESMGDIALTARLIAQAAKEVGALTDRRPSESGGEDGEPIERPIEIDLSHLSDRELYFLDTLWRFRSGEKIELPSEAERRARQQKYLSSAST